MSATTSQRNTIEFSPNPIPNGVPWGVTDNSVGLKGTIGVIELSTGYLKMGVTGSGLVCAGRIDADWDNTGTGHVAGAISVPVRQGCFPWYMGTSSDAITNLNAGSLCYIIDNQTVGLTDGGGTRSVAGIIAFLAPVPTDTAYQQVYVIMGEWVGAVASGTVAGGALLMAGVQSNTGLKTFSDGTIAQNNSGGTFATTLHSAATAARSFTFPDIASATGAALEGTQTWVGVKTWAASSDPVFSKEENHTLAVVDTTTAATVGGALTIVAGKSGTSGIGGAVTVRSGAGDTTGAGGVATLIAGAGGSASGAGGAVAMTGGAGTAGNSAGGAATQTGGAGSGNAAGGASSVVGGAGGLTGVGGAVAVTGGAGGGTSGVGGAASLTAGAATNGGSAGGAVSVVAGAGNAAGAGGAGSLTGGAGGLTGVGGALSIAGGAGGATSGTGGAVTIAGGAGTNGGANGGMVSINGGAKNGGGTAGIVRIGASNTSAVQLAFGNAIADPGNAGAVVVTYSGVCNLTSAGAETRTVAIPAFIGQTLTLCVDTYAGATVVTFASAINVAGNTTWTTSAVDQNITLVGCTKAGTKAWRVVAKDGGTLG